MTKKPETAETSEDTVVSTFDKQQILKSQRYQKHHDLLTALLKDGQQYSHENIETLIDNFMKGKVK